MRPGLSQCVLLSIAGQAGIIALYDGLGTLAGCTLPQSLGQPLRNKNKTQNNPGNVIDVEATTTPLTTYIQHR